MKPTNTIKNKHSFSRLIAGTMHWGVWGKNMNTKKRIKLIESAHDIGITTFDHADIYGNYTTEKDFGTAFSQSSLSRADCQFISKCGIAKVCENTTYKTKHYRYSASHIIESVNNSLRNLKTEYLDLLLLHRPSPLMRADEVASAVHTLMDTGKILSFGVSNFTSPQIDLLKKHLPVTVNQIEISLTHHDSMFDGQLDYCQTNNILPMSWSPLGNLKHSQDRWPSKLKSAVTTLTKKHNTSFAPLVISWLLKHPANMHPILGTTNPDRLVETQQALEIHLDEEDWFFLLEAVRERPCA